MENAEEKIKSKRGGARAGAGRKKIADRECLVSYRISALAKEQLTAFAKARGLSANEALNSILEALKVSEE